MREKRSVVKWYRCIQFEVLLGIALTLLCADYVFVRDPVLRRDVRLWIWLGFAVACAGAAVFWLVAMRFQRWRDSAGLPVQGLWLLYDFVMVSVCMLLRSL